MDGFRLMGILNVTPDSFSDGGTWTDPEAATMHGVAMAREGATLIDVGGESTRPGAAPVSETEELRRTIPVVEALVAHLPPGVEVSIDTTKAAVADAALAAGARYVNDVSAMSADPGMLSLVASAPDVRCCLMHRQGTPATMQDAPRYADVVGEVASYLAGRVEAATRAGISPDRIDVDPGFGFGKTVEHNLALLRDLARIADLGLPVLVGLSRKSTLGKLTGAADRASLDAASVAAAVLAFDRGARRFRVHDVSAHRDALMVATALAG